MKIRQKAYCYLRALFIRPKRRFLKRYHVSQARIEDINDSVPKNLDEAMARMEGGKNWTMEDLYLGWIRWAGCSLPAR